MVRSRQKRLRQNHIARIGLLASLINLTAPAQVVIDQIYGGGGNSGSNLQNDYVQLFNRGSNLTSIEGWSIQYASANGSSWDRTILKGSLAPGQRLLIQEARGAGGGSSLPSPDVAGGINFSASSGKVALVKDSLPLAGQSPSGDRIADFVGYGESNASFGSPAPSPGNTLALMRKGSGCQDTRNNQSDFELGNPAPQNSSAPSRACFVAPVISSIGVTNAASFENRPMAPGEIITIFGSNLGPDILTNLQLSANGSHVTKSLAGTRVLFDGIAAPLIYTQASQVSAIVPFALSGATQSRIQLEYYGKISNTIVLPVSRSAPGIFTASGSGTGGAAALNEELTINSSSFPARKGSVVAIYATGGGQTQPQGDDGAIVEGTLPSLTLPVTLQIADRTAEILYAGPAPSAVSGLIQVNFRIPTGIAAGRVGIKLVIDGESSQSETYIYVAADGSEPLPGVGPEVEDKLIYLQSHASTEPLPELPTDQSPIPSTWLGLLSWNIQVGGTSTDPGALRPPMVQAALARAFGGTYKILAAEEIPNSTSAEYLRTLLPRSTGPWSSVFLDTSDPMDNGTWIRNSVVVRDSFTLFANENQNSAGELAAESSKAEHPPQVAQFAVGDFDFTLLTVPLTFANGNTSESATEMRHILDYLAWYFDQADHDPDVLICGDFNMPSRLSGTTGRSGITLDQVIAADPRFSAGERRFVVTVHEPTSRNSATNGGMPVNNYDHCVISANATKGLIQARRVMTNILTDDPQDPESRLTSDHFPVIALFRTQGSGIFLDFKTRIRPPVGQTR